MNYGKLAYLKVQDLENQFKDQLKSADGLKCFELKNDNLNLTASTTLTYDLTMLNPSQTDDCCLFLTTVFTATQNTNITLKLCFNNSIIATQTKAIGAGDTIIKISSVASSLISESGKISLVIEPNNSVVFKSYDLIVLGGETDEVSQQIELKAFLYDGNLAVSYILDGTIYYYSGPMEEFNGQTATFTGFCQAKTHAVCYDCYNSENLLTFAYVDNSNNLYLSRVGENTETFIDGGVSAVCVGNSLKTEDPSLMIVYIKNGNVLFKTIIDGVLSESYSVGLPPAIYTSLKNASSDTTRNYLIATDYDGNNYFCSTVMEPNIERLIENISFDAQITLKALVKVFGENGAIENITCALAVRACAKHYADLEYNFNDITCLEVGVHVTAQAYTLGDDLITYGVEINTHEVDFRQLVSGCIYTDDATNLTPALISLENETYVFHDNGWFDRWPYNEIRPCLFKDGVATYLDKVDLTKSEDGLTTGLDITSGEAGDVMVEIPRIYYRMCQKDDGRWIFKMSNKARPGYVCYGHTYKGQQASKLYFGVYASTLLNNNVYSLSNKTKYQVTGKTLEDLRTLTSLRGENYSMPSMFNIMMIDMLFIILFKSISYPHSVGYGYLKTAFNALKITGASNSYPSGTYGFLTSNQMKCDRFLNIETFTTFGNFCIEGVFCTAHKVGFMDLDGAHNNWANTDCEDYMFYNITMPTYCYKNSAHMISNHIGVFPTAFGTETNFTGFDGFRSQGTTLTSANYRLHFSNINSLGVGIFNYIVVFSNSLAGNFGHRLVYYKI